VVVHQLDMSPRLSRCSGTSQVSTASLYSFSLITFPDYLTGF
jgi:hypothetical protein